jgi:hypothetical protein
MKGNIMQMKKKPSKMTVAPVSEQNCSLVVFKGTERMHKEKESAEMEK